MTSTCYRQKGLVTRYTQVKYDGHDCYQSKDMANVKVFADKQTDGPKNICTQSMDTGA